MDWLIRYFWVIALLVLGLNALVLSRNRWRAPSPEKDPVYREFYLRYLYLLAIPWIVMGVGILVGDVASPFHFLRPHNGNVFILAFQMALVVVWLSAFIWFYGLGGAEFLVQNPGLMRGEVRSVTALKLLGLLAFAGGAIALGAIWFGLFPSTDILPIR